MIKTYLKIIFIVFLVVGCNRIRKKTKKTVNEAKTVVIEKANYVKNKAIDKLREPIIKNYNIFQKFPELEKEKFNIVNIEGIKCDYFPSFYKYYFKYTGNEKLIKSYISKIESNYSEIVPESTFHKITLEELKKENENLTDYELKKAEFFFEYNQIKPKYLLIYKCTKNPEVHIIIYDTLNNFIYHKIENFLE